MKQSTKKLIRKLTTLAYDNGPQPRPVWRRTGRKKSTWSQFRPYAPPGPLFDAFVVVVVVFSILVTLLA